MFYCDVVMTLYTKRENSYKNLSQLKKTDNSKTTFCQNKIESYLSPYNANVIFLYKDASGLYGVNR